MECPFTWFTRTTKVNSRIIAETAITRLWSI